VLADAVKQIFVMETGKATSESLSLLSLLALYLCSATLATEYLGLLLGVVAHQAVGSLISSSSPK